MSATLQLNCYYKNKNIDRYKLPFKEKIQIIEKDIIDNNIPEEVFKHGKDKQQMSITLITKETNIEKEFNFHVYYGENSANVHLDSVKINSYEIILRDIEDLNILGDGYEFTKLDIIGNKDKKRLVLINYGTSILTINKIILDLNTILLENLWSISYFSFELSEIDYKTSKFILKQFKKIEEYNLDLLIKNKKQLNDFANEFFNIVELETNLYKKKF